MKALNIKSDDIIKIVVAIITIVVALFVGKKILDALNSEVNAYNKETNKKNLTYPESDYLTMADSLFVATKGDWFSIATGTDEKAIYATLKRLNNIDDWKHLVFIYATDKQGYTLPAKLIRVLGSREQEKVNNILSKIGASIY